MDNRQSETPIKDESIVKTIWQFLVERAAQAPIKVVTASAILIGGLIMFMHFNTIQYLPDINLENATSVIFGVALLGCALILALAITMVVPSFLLRVEVWNPHFLHYRGTPDGPRIRVSPRTERLRRVIFMGVNACYGALAFAVVVICFTFLLGLADKGYGASLRGWLAIGGGAAIGLLTALLSWIKTLDTKHHRQKPRALAPNIPHKTLFFVWLMMFGSFIFVLALAASGLKKSDIAGHLNLLACAAIYVFLNSLLASVDLRKPKNYWWFPIGAAAMIVAYLWLPANPLSVTRSVFSSLGLGSAGTTRYIVKQPTCDALNLLVAGACQYRSDTAGCVSPYSLSNRVGSDYILEFKVIDTQPEKGTPVDHQNGEAKMVRVIVPKSEVLAWSVIDARQGARAPCIEPVSQATPAGHVSNK